MPRRPLEQLSPVDIDVLFALRKISKDGENSNPINEYFIRKQIQEGHKDKTGKPPSKSSVHHSLKRLVGFGLVEARKVITRRPDKVDPNNTEGLKHEILVFRIAKMLSNPRARIWTRIAEAKLANTALAKAIRTLIINS